MQTPTPSPQQAAVTDAPENTRCTAAALYLMSHYAQRPCPLVAHAIADQLGMLSRQYAGGTSRLIQSLAAALLPRWQAIAGGSTTTLRH